MKFNTRVTKYLLLAIMVLSIVLPVYLLRDLDWHMLAQFTPLHLAGILGLLILGTLFYTLAISVMVKAVEHPSTLWQAYLILTASLSANYVTPVKIGIPLRIYLYQHFMHIPTATGTALVTLETITGLLVPTLVAILGITTLFTNLKLTVPIILLSILSIGTGLIVYLPTHAIKTWMPRSPRSKITARTLHFIENVQMGFRSVSLMTTLKISLLFLLNLTTSAGIVHLILRVLGFTINPLVLLYVLAIAITAGNLSLIPMGLGVRDISFTMLLQYLGVPQEIAISTAIIQRLFSPGWPLLLGLISSNILGLSEILHDTQSQPTEAGNDSPCKETG